MHATKFILAFLILGGTAARGTPLHLLLLGNTQNEGKTPLEHALSAIDKWRGPLDTIVFIPYASLDENASTEKAKVALGKLHITVESLPDDEAAAAKVLKHARAIYVGGGSTYKLLDTAVDGNKITLGGSGARVFRHGDTHATKAREFPGGSGFDFQLDTQAP